MLLWQRTPVRRIDTAEPQAVLTQLSGRTDMDAFTAFIDVGALFKGRNNQEVAEAMLAFQLGRKGRFHAILFWDDATNALALLSQGTQGSVVTPVSGSSPQDIQSACEKVGRKPQEVFCYYDERHTTGADLEYPADSKAFVTTGIQTKKDSLFQGVARMRGLMNGTQSVEIVLHRNEEELMQRAFGDQKALDINDVIFFADIVQAENELQENYDATHQSLLAHARQWIRQQVLDADSEAKAQRLSRMGFEIMETGTADDPFLDYGPIAAAESAEQALGRYADWLVRRLRAVGDRSMGRSLDGLQSELQKIIHDQVAKRCLPAQVPGKVDVAERPLLGQEMMQEVSHQQERHREQEREQEQEQEHFFPSGRVSPFVSHPWTVDLFSPSFQLESRETQTHPEVTSLRSVVKDRLKQPDVASMIDSNILVTGNFVHTLGGGKGRSVSSGAERGSPCSDRGGKGTNVGCAVIYGGRSLFRALPRQTES